MGSHPLQGAITEAMRLEARIIQEDDASDEEQHDQPKRGTKRRYIDVDVDDDVLDSRPQTAKRVVRAISQADTPLQVPATAPSSSSDDNVSVLRQVKALLDTTNAIATRMQETQYRNAEEAYHRDIGSHGQPPFRPGPRSPPPLRPPMTCYNCGRRGDKAAECFSRRPLSQGPNRQGDRRDSYPTNRTLLDRTNSGTADRGRSNDERSRGRNMNSGETKPQRQLSDDDRQALMRTMSMLRAAGIIPSTGPEKSTTRVAESAHPN